MSEKDSGINVGARDHSRIALGTACLGQSLLWVLIQRGLLTSSLETLPKEAHSLCSLTLLVCVVVTAAVAGAFPRQVGILMSKAHTFLVAGLACFGALLLRQIMSLAFYDCGWLTPAFILLIAIEAVSFCLVFLGWVQWTCAYAEGHNLPEAILVQLAAIALSFLVAPLNASGTGYLSVLRMLIVPISTLCLIAVRRLSPIWDIRDNQASGNVAKRTAPWLIATSAGFLLIGLIGYIPHLNEAASESYSEGILSFGFAILSLVPLAFLCAKPEAIGSKNAKMILGCVLAVTLAIIACFFSLTLVLLTGSDIQFEIARFMRRLSRIAVFLLILVTVCQMRLSPVRAFSWAFLVPAFIPKALLNAIDYLNLNVLGSLGGEGLGVTVTIAGFLFTVCIVVALFLNMDGRITKSLVPDGMPWFDGANQADDGTKLRRKACTELAENNCLSDREAEILFLFSCGHSIQKVCEELSLSKGTVNTHSQSLYRKLDVHSKQEIIDLVDGLTARS